MANITEIKILFKIMHTLLMRHFILWFPTLTWLDFSCVVDVIRAGVILMLFPKMQGDFDLSYTTIIEIPDVQTPLTNPTTSCRSTYLMRPIICSDQYFHCSEFCIKQQRFSSFLCKIDRKLVFQSPVASIIHFVLPQIKFFFVNCSHRPTWVAYKRTSVQCYI